VFLAAAASLILAGATMTVPTAPAMACSGCHKLAKAKFPDDKAARHAYKKHCKAHHKAWRKAHKKHHLFGK
jgi:hypothetical protein